MSLRARIFIIVSVVVLIILGISLFLMSDFGKNAISPAAPTEQNLPETTQTNNSPVNTTEQPVVNTTIPTIPVNITTEDTEKNAAKQLAKVFIERYGTYSTDNGSDNIRDVQGLVTPALWSTLSARINSTTVNENVAPSGAFYGISTQVFSMELVNWLPDNAKVSLQLVRTEEKNGIRTVKHQNAEVIMVKQNEQWLVQNFKWL